MISALTKNRKSCFLRFSRSYFPTNDLENSLPALGHLETSCNSYYRNMSCSLLISSFEQMTSSPFVRQMSVPLRWESFHRMQKSHDVWQAKGVDVIFVKNEMVGNVLEMVESFQGRLLEIKCERSAQKTIFGFLPNQKSCRRRNSLNTQDTSF